MVNQEQALDTRQFQLQVTDGRGPLIQFFPAHLIIRKESEILGYQRKNHLANDNHSKQLDSQPSYKGDELLLS